MSTDYIVYIDSVDFDEGPKKDTLAVTLFEYEFHWVIDVVVYIDGDLKRFTSNSYLKTSMNKTDAISMANNALRTNESFYLMGFVK